MNVRFHKWRTSLAAVAAGLLAAAGTVVAAPAANAAEYPIIPGEQIDAVAVNSESVVDQSKNKLNGVTWSESYRLHTLNQPSTVIGGVGRLEFSNITPEQGLINAFAFCIEPETPNPNLGTLYMPSEGAPKSGLDPVAVAKAVAITNFVTSTEETIVKFGPDGPQSVPTGKPALYNSKIDPLLASARLEIEPVKPVYAWDIAANMAIWSLLHEGYDLSIDESGNLYGRFGSYGEGPVDLQSMEKAAGNTGRYEPYNFPRGYATPQQVYTIYEKLLTVAANSRVDEASLAVSIDKEESKAEDAGDNIKLSVIVPVGRAWYPENIPGSEGDATRPWPNVRYVPAQVTYELYHVADDGKETLLGTETAPGNGEGTITLTGSIPESQKGDSFLVKAMATAVATGYGYAVNNGPNGQDYITSPAVIMDQVASQSFTLESDKTEKSMKTTVTANGSVASDSAAAEVGGSAVVDADGNAVAVPVTDKIDYTGFVKGKPYTFIGTLVDVTDGNKVVKIAREYVSSLESADGTVTIDFGSVELKPEHKYVVFERAYDGDVAVPAKPEKDNGTDENPALPGVSNTVIAKHIDPSDTAQTFEVTKRDVPTTPEVEKSMKTTVTANGSVASDSAAAEVEGSAVVDADGNAVAVPVTDKIDYTGFVKGKPYTFIGTLVDVTDGNKVVKIAREYVSSLESADGTVTIDFGSVELKPEHKYVVFERAYDGDVAVPAKPEKDNGTDENPALPGVSNTVIAKHIDPSDTAQTVVVGERDEVPPTPPTPPTTPAGSSVNPWLLIPIVPAVIGGIAALAGGSSAPVEVPVAPTTAPAPAPAPETVKVPSKGVEKRPMLAQTGANVLWVVLAGLIAAIAGGLLIARRKNA